MDSSKRSSVELKGWHNVRLPRRVRFHRHINFRPGTLAIPCMFIQFLLPFPPPPDYPRTVNRRHNGFLSTHALRFGFFFCFHLSLVARFPSPRPHDRCVALTRFLKYSGEFAASQFSAISQKPPFILSPHRDGAVKRP